MSLTETDAMLELSFLGFIFWAKVYQSTFWLKSSGKQKFNKPRPCDKGEKCEQRVKTLHASSFNFTWTSTKKIK